MKKVFFFLSVVAVMASCSQQPAKVAGINYQYMDTTALPGNDFAQYATGHWVTITLSHWNIPCGDLW